MEQMTSICDMVGQIMQKKEEERRILEDQVAKDRYWKIPICYDDDEDYTIAITPRVIQPGARFDFDSSDDDCGCSPLSVDDDYPYGEDIDYVDASPPDAEIVSLEVVEIVIPEVGGIDTDILLTIKDDILQEISNGSTTTRSDYSLPDYEAFYLNDDHTKEKSSGSTNTHADFSQYDSFIFDLLINPFPPTDRSDFYHEEFADELAHIISPPEYDCFYFNSEP
ncbi:hypothetical protein Tco_0924118 [Tanacetum coccineum]|uniref:Uncharacterized protein n=1 Tax=Tanacetum coccineum TaxID=301880 RepID=A0ABQ5D9Z2_9ASTR